ncbi:MAG TPA: pitrilysin family protein [Candidatus Binatia bacterium]|nr:pitrilysin family protein [Candidatus Binatia bacterium]
MRGKTLVRYPARMLALLLVGVTLVAPTAPHLGAQESIETPASKVERKNKAPLSREVLRVNLPKPVEAKLENGLTVLILEDHRTPSVFVQLHISGAGALFEPPSMTGLANVTAQMLREGTQSRNSVQIAEEIDRLGATLGAGGSFGSSQVVLNASGLSDNFDSWFALAVDILLNPSFPAEELQKLKQRQRAQLRQQRSAPNFLLNERFHRAVYRDHPAAIVSPTSESLEALTREALVQWHRERYAPQNALLAIAGDVRAQELIPRLEKWFAGWQRKDVKRPWPANPVAATSRKAYLVHRPNSVQTTLALGNIAIDRRSSDYVPMVVMNYILGGGSSGRLFLNLREEKGYTYGVYSDFTALRYPGPWRAGGNMRTEVTAGALVEFFNEIRRIRDQTVPPAELEDGKRAIAARFALSLEQPTTILGLAVSRVQFRLPDDYWDTYPDKIMAVTAEDVQRVARKYLDPDALQIVAVGDGLKIQSVLEPYGPVEVYDSSGKLTSISKQ